MHIQTFLTQVLAHHFRAKLNKKVLLSATTGAAARRLSRSASTVHNNFVIPTKGFIGTLRHDIRDAEARHEGRHEASGRVLHRRDEHDDI